MVAGQPTVAYSYDDGDRLAQITQGASSVGFTYDNANRRRTLTLPNGITAEYAYDAASEITGITYKLGANVLGDLTYGYDDAGRRTQMGGSLARTGLRQALSSAAYDAANELTQWGSTNLAYDGNGNLVSDGVNTYTWNVRNQLTSISGGTTAGFQYDASGRRIARGGTTFFYDGVNPIQELSAGAATANLLTGLGVDEVFTRTDSSGPSYFLTDALGSSLALTDSTGALQTQYTYEPFGNTTSSGPASSNTFQYTGRENDGTGLYYYRARYYSPTLHRFISEDPIGLAAGVDFFTYTGNNPIDLNDPYGLDSRRHQDRDWLESLLDFSSGFSDTVTSGLGLSHLVGLPSLTEYYRQQMGYEDLVYTSGGGYIGGEIAGDVWGAAFGTALGAELTGWTSRIAIHGPHHEFGSLGRLSHLQTTIWRIGVKGSDITVRIPLPWR